MWNSFAETGFSTLWHYLRKNNYLWNLLQIYCCMCLADLYFLATFPPLTHAQRWRLRMFSIQVSAMLSIEDNRYWITNGCWQGRRDLTYLIRSSFSHWSNEIDENREMSAYRLWDTAFWWNNVVKFAPEYVFWTFK